jgi:hypothetical protein
MNDDRAMCPVLPFALRCNKLSKVWKQADLDGRDRDRDAAHDQFRAVVEIASHFTPRSAAGREFMVLSAAAEVDRTSDADAPAVREASKQLVERLLRQVSLATISGRLDDLREFTMHAEDAATAA